jgi:hypothetical protein
LEYTKKSIGLAPLFVPNPFITNPYYDPKDPDPDIPKKNNMPHQALFVSNAVRLTKLK